MFQRVILSFSLALSFGYGGDGVSTEDDCASYLDPACSYSPIVLDLDGDGVSLSDVKSGVLFDLRESGRAVRTAWPMNGDALLVLDRDGDGQITSGGELFGTSLRPDGSRWSDGFALLGLLDGEEEGGNGDGQLDAKDEIFAKLLLWRDGDRNGVSEPNELVKLGDARVVALSLHVERRLTFDRFGNTLALWAAFVRREESGNLVRGTMVDAWFRIRPAEAPVPIARAEDLR